LRCRSSTVFLNAVPQRSPLAVALSWSPAGSEGELDHRKLYVDEPRPPVEH
jgi:hypothetical protein